jgi:hypothetical protein
MNDRVTRDRPAVDECPQPSRIIVPRLDSRAPDGPIISRRNQAHSKCSKCVKRHGASCARPDSPITLTHHLFRLGLGYVATTIDGRRLWEIAR